MCEWNSISSPRFLLRNRNQSAASSQMSCELIFYYQLCKYIFQTPCRALSSFLKVFFFWHALNCIVKNSAVCQLLCGLKCKRWCKRARLKKIFNSLHLGTSLKMTKIRKSHQMLGLFYVTRNCLVCMSQEVISNKRKTIMGMTPP